MRASGSWGCDDTGTNHSDDPDRHPTSWPDGSSFWRERAIELGIVVPIAVGLALAWRWGAVADDVPLWLLFGTLCATYVVSTAVGMVLPPDCATPLLWLRLLPGIAGGTAAMYVTGLGPALAIGYATLAAAAIRSSGARAAPPVMVWSVIGVGVGQLAVAGEIAPSMFSHSRSHAMALLAVTALVPAIAFLGAAVARKETSEETATRMVDLAHTLAQPASRREQAQRLAEAVPHVAGLERSIVLVADPESATLLVAGVHGYPPAAERTLPGMFVPLDETPVLDGLIRRRDIIHATPATPDPWLAEHFDRFGATETFAVTIGAPGRPLGLLIADRARGRATGITGHLRRRLLGMADQAAIALENGRLIEQERDVIEQLRLSDTMKSEFLAVVSHELKTPLSVMLGAARTLQWRGNVLDPTIRDALVESVVRRAEQLNGLVEDLLQASGNLTLDLATVELTSIASSAAADAAAVHPDARVEVLPSAGRMTVLADHSRLRQVLDNLIANAVKYAPGSRIEITVGWTDDESGILCVSDGGPGMDEAQASKAFDAFYQADSSAVRKVGGLGLGLHICRRIIEAHGGRIWIESTVGRGTRVNFTVPANGPTTRPSLSGE